MWYSFKQHVIYSPCRYGRSILTVPWIELGGKCAITCAQTGFNAEIEFLCKPFYGGRKHQVRHSASRQYIIESIPCSLSVRRKSHYILYFNVTHTELPTMYKMYTLYSIFLFKYKAYTYNINIIYHIFMFRIYNIYTCLLPTCFHRYFPHMYGYTILGSG